MAVDTSLIEGAYMANLPQKSSGQMAGEAIGKITGSITGAVTGYMKEQAEKAAKDKAELEKAEQEFQDNLTAAADQVGLNAVEYENFNNLLGSQGQFKSVFVDPNSTPEDKARVIRQVTDLAETTRDYEELINYVGEEAQKGGEISRSVTSNKLNYYEEATPLEAQWKNELIQDLVSSHVSLTRDPNDTNGEMGYVSTKPNDQGEWEEQFIPLSEMKKAIEESKVDTGFREGFKALNDLVIQDSAKNTKMEFTKWNEPLVEGKVQELVDSSTNLLSLALDPMTGGTTNFYDHTIEMLMKNTYEGLGIDARWIDEADVDGNNEIDSREAIDIMKELMKKGNEDFLKQDLVRYFTLKIKQQGWDVGAGSKVIKVEKDKTKLNQTQARALLSQYEEGTQEWDDEYARLKNLGLIG